MSLALIRISGLKVTPVGLPAIREHHYAGDGTVTAEAAYCGLSLAAPWIAQVTVEAATFTVPVGYRHGVVDPPSRN